MSELKATIHKLEDRNSILLDERNELVCFDVIDVVCIDASRKLNVAVKDKNAMPTVELLLVFTRQLNPQHASSFMCSLRNISLFMSVGYE